MSNIKTEFEKAYLDRTTGLSGSTATKEKVALWAAQWAMERCAQIPETERPCGRGDCDYLSNKIRQLIKDLS